MADSKKVKKKQKPAQRSICEDVFPTSFYSQNPSWAFVSVDCKEWAFSEKRIGRIFWKEILPRMKALETQTWGEILIAGKKQNHLLNPKSLSKKARKRLAELYIEEESIVSLRISGTHRLYGYISEDVFMILWYDDDHGDNETCVCRSRQKHT